MPIVLQELVTRFVTAVQSQGECIRADASARGNDFARAYIEAGHALLSGGDHAIDAFATLLHHADSEVRVMAGAFLLEARTKAAVAALQPLADGVGLSALGARMTLERYKRGELRLQ